MSHSDINYKSSMVTLLQLLGKLPAHKMEMLEREGLIKVKQITEYGSIHSYSRDLVLNPHNWIGLTYERIKKFECFFPDSSEKYTCAICLEEADIFTELTRLDCDGQHVYCQPCIARHFETDNQCPTCRYVFKN